MRRRTVPILAIAGLAALAAAPVKAATFVYTATLNGAQEVPANASPATGSITVTVDDAANSFAVDLTFSGLTGGPASAAHIHCCAPPGANAPVVTPFAGFPGTTSGTYSNTFVLTPAAAAPILAGLQAGQAYANIHNQTYPGGEIRGQLRLAVPEPATWAMMLVGFGAVGWAMRRRRAKVAGWPFANEARLPT